MLKALGIITISLVADTCFPSIQEVAAGELEIQSCAQRYLPQLGSLSQKWKRQIRQNCALEKKELILLTLKHFFF